MTYSSVTTMLASLEWSTLALRRKIARLNLFYKIMSNPSVLVLPPYYQYTHRNTLHHHHLHLIKPQTNTSAYQKSFFPRTSKYQNHLPMSIVELHSYDTFQTLNFYNEIIVYMLLPGHNQSYCLPSSYHKCFPTL